MSMVRASALSGYRELVNDLGGQAEPLLERFRIPASAVSEPQGFVSYSSLIRLLEQTAKDLDCKDFGLRLSTRQDLGILGPLGVAVRNCETLGEAMQCASRYMFVHSPAISFTPQVAEQNDRVLLVFQILLDENVGPATQVTELSIGLVTRIIAMLTEEAAPLVGVRFRHLRCSPVASYRTYFGAPVSFGSDVSAVELDAAKLALRIHNASLQLRELAEDYLELRHADPHAPFSIRVRLVIQRSLGTGAASCVDVASAFALHPRTLQRQLRREGTTFERLKDEARSELARGYIANPDLPLSRVAALLDYSEQSALSRSCRRWFGQAPRELRAGQLNR
jgi:AraC-like DNA-binding protein